MNTDLQVRNKGLIDSRAVVRVLNKRSKKMARMSGTKVRYKDPVTGRIFDATIQRVIKGRPVQYVLNVKDGGTHMIGRIAYSDEIWSRKKK